MGHLFYFVEILNGDTRHIQQINIDQLSVHPCTLVRIFETFSPFFVLNENLYDHQLCLFSNDKRHNLKHILLACEEGIP